MPASVRAMPRLAKSRATAQSRAVFDRHPRLLALALGFASACGFAPLNWWPLTLAALAVLMALLLRQTRLRDALLMGWLFGWAHFTLGLNWIQKSFTYQDQMPHWLGYLAPALLSVYLALFPAAAAGLAWRHGRHDRRVFVLLLAAAWIVVELLRAKLFTGFPWNPLGATLLPLIELARAARWVGTYGLGGMVILAAGAILLGLGRHRRFAVGILASLIALFVVGVQTPRPIPADAPRVLIVQPNIDQNTVQDDASRQRVLATYAALTRRRQPGPTLVLWPEGAIRYLIEPGYPRGVYLPGEPDGVRLRLASLLRPGDLLVTGADSLIYDAQPQLTGAHNAMFVIDAAGTIRARYDKAHLVPWGEYLPARAILEPIGLSRVVPGAIDFIPGPGPATLSLPGFGALGLQVCYEIVFSGEVIDRTARPRVLFNPSNDAWFGTWGPPQHLAQARMRAIEEGVPVMRSTPTGISALVAADGRLLAAIPSGVRGTIAARLPVAAPPTLFARFGNLLPWLFALLLAAIGVALARRAR